MKINQIINEGINEGQVFYAKNPDGTKTYALVKDAEHLANLEQKYSGAQVQTLDFARQDVRDWLDSRGVNLRRFTPGMETTVRPNRGWTTADAPTKPQNVVWRAPGYEPGKGSPFDTSGSTLVKRTNFPAKDDTMAEGDGDHQIRPGMKVSQGTVVKVDGNTVVVKTSNGDMMTMNIHDIQQGVAEDYRDALTYGQDPDWDNMLLRREAKRKGMSVAQYKNYLEKQKQDQDYELNIGSSGRAELKQKADELAEIKREKLRNERLHDEDVAFQRAETAQQRKDEMKKIADKYQHDLTVIDKEHRNNMEAIRTGNNHETDKMSMEFRHEKEMWDRNNPQQQPQSSPEKPIPEPEEKPRPRPGPEAGNNFDQDTGEPIRPQSNQWHTSQQVGYRPSKPSKDNDDDVIDVEPKSNKPLRISEKITVVKDPSKATGIQQTGGITHGSVYSGKPAPQPYRITPESYKTESKTKASQRGGQVHGQPIWQPTIKPEVQPYTPGKPLPQSLQQKLDGKPNTGRAVDAKGRTQQQWVKLVKTKFPDAKIYQSKMLDGPVFAMLSDGRKLSWNKVEQGMAEGNRKSEPPEADYGDDYQDMVSRVKKLAGLGPLKTQYDPQKRVYRNVPTAVQPKKEQP